MTRLQRLKKEFNDLKREERALRAAGRLTNNYWCVLVAMMNFNLEEQRAEVARLEQIEKGC